MGPVLALKPIDDLFGVEQIFATSMQAVSGAGYPGVPSLDILDNVIPYIGNEEEKMEEETLKLLGKLEGHTVRPLAARMSASCNRVAVVDATPSAFPSSSGSPQPTNRFSPPGPSSIPWQDCICPPRGAAGRVGSAKRSPAAAPRSQSRQRHGGHSGTPAPLRRA